MQNGHEDNFLIKQAIRGDAYAFEQLMRRHESRMYSVAIRMCGNREDAQDCVQDAMLRIYRALDRFKGQSSFSTWVYRITMNTCLDELRRRKVRASTSLDTLLESGWSPTDETDTPEHHAIDAERRKALSGAIQSLPEDMRSAIVLREMQGLSYEEISDVLSVNVGTIKSRISRGREKLREKLKKNAELFDGSCV